MAFISLFLISGGVLLVAAVFMTRYADAIAENTGLGRIWIGSVLLAGATSLPELITDISAVILDAPDLAVGDLLGSSVANMLILSIIDLVSRQKQVFQKVALDHALAAGLAISLNSFAAIFILMRFDFSLARMSPGPLALFMVYLAGARTIYRHATRNSFSIVSEGVTKKISMSLRRAITGFLLATLALTISAPFFAWSAKGIAKISGFGETFVGTLLVGLSTSLPELIASITAVKMGAFDLAVANLFGSNAINMAIFLPLDIVQGGNLLSVIDQNHVLTALVGTILMSIGLSAIMYRAKHRIPVIEPDSYLMLAIYIMAMVLLYFKVTSG